MDYFGINSSGEMPGIREIFPDELVQPTQLVQPGPHTSPLLVGESGQLSIREEEGEREDGAEQENS